MKSRLIVLISILITFIGKTYGIGTANECSDTIALLKHKLQKYIEKEDLQPDTISNFFINEVLPLVRQGNSEAAKIMLPYLNPQENPEFASEVHNLAFQNLGEESYVETALWLYTFNPEYGTKWTIQCIAEGIKNPRLYRIIARAYENKLLDNDEVGISAIVRDAANGNIQSMFQVVGFLTHEKDFEQAKDLLNKIIEQSTKAEGYDSLLDECLYYTAPMELSGYSFANYTNFYVDSSAPIYTRNINWTPQGEPVNRVKARRTLGYLYLLEYDMNNGFDNLNKAAVWDWNIAMEHFNKFVEVNPEAALGLLKTAASKGSKECARTLGLEYSNGRYVQKNPTLALKYAKQGFDSDDDSGTSEFVMARALQANGQQKEADKWMLKSANKGCESALLVLRLLNIR